MDRRPHHPKQRPGDTARGAPRRRYVAPRLEVVGALRTVVLGSAPGFGDSGAGGLPELPPGGGP